MRTLRTTMIADEFFRILDEHDMVVSKKESMGGYYLFDFGKDSVWHFNVKGAKRWKWGLWINRLDEHGRKFKISIFLQHEDYIDKFKPTCSPMHVEFDLNFEQKEWKWYFRNCLSDFLFDVKKVVKHPLIAKYYTYAIDKNFLLWWIDDAWFFRIKNPLYEFHMNKLSKYEAKFFGFLIKCRFPRLKTFVKDMPDFWYPKCELHVCYDYYYAKCEGMSRVYHSRYMRAIEDFINKHCHAWRMGHYETLADNRGFYFKEDK